MQLGQRILQKYCLAKGVEEVELNIKKLTPTDKVIALAGNPNVGKSTVFNSLTGLNQHTGNWPGKTVTNAQGYCHYSGSTYVLVDLPGTYSLMAHSAEEEVARNFICFGEADGVVAVCDATCLERNLNLVLQILEITSNLVVCVNLMDEAKKKNIKIDLDSISKKLGVAVIGTIGRKKSTLNQLMSTVKQMLSKPSQTPVFQPKYPEAIENAIVMLEPAVDKHIKKINARWLSLKLLEGDETLITALNEYLGFNPLAKQEIQAQLEKAQHYLACQGVSGLKFRDQIVASLVLAAQDICTDTVHFDREKYNERDRKIDRLLTNKWVGFPIMLALLMGVFWLTITGANYPSQLLSQGMFWVQDQLTILFEHFNAPDWLHGMLVLGVYRVLAWVVSVMLPPMAIFFPLFTLLEDLGYLPRVAFNLDKYFKKASACGKQALTMCMGFGCNAAGVVGCRIIDSPRERLIATITNNFVPCNGRFPLFIAITTMFFIGNTTGPYQSLLSSILLTGIIVLGVFMTFLVSRILSKTILIGVPSSFTLELPPYRRPQIGRIIMRSILDRTLFVLGRAVMVAAPAGLIIWLMANISMGNTTLLATASNFLDPFGRLLGMDGVILLAFILGFPANEIVIPIIIMSYMATGSILELESLTELKNLLVENGWTWVTAINTMLFSLMHWPCSTSCLTIKKETQSFKWTVVSFLLPSIAGVLVCLSFTSLARLLGF